MRNPYPHNGDSLNRKGNSTGTLMNRPRHNTTHPWKQGFDGHLNMNGHLRQQQCLDLQDCHNVRLIELSFAPKRAPLSGMRRIIIHTRGKTWTPCVLEMCQNKTVRSNTFIASPTSVYTWTHSTAGTWSTNSEVKHTHLQDVLMMRSMDIGKAVWNEPSNICGDAQTINNPHAHKNYREACKQQWKKQNQNTTRAWHQPNHNKQEHDAILTRRKHIQPSENTPMREHSASNPEIGVRTTQPIGLGETIWETASAKKKTRLNHITNTQTKAVPQEPLLKKMTTQSSHAQLVFHRDHTCNNDTTKQHTTIRQIPTTSHRGFEEMLKKKVPKWSFLQKILSIHRTTEIKSKPVYPLQMKSDATEVLKNWLTKIPN